MEKEEGGRGTIRFHGRRRGERRKDVGIVAQTMDREEGRRGGKRVHSSYFPALSISVRSETTRRGKSEYIKAVNRFRLGRLRPSHRLSSLGSISLAARPLPSLGRNEPANCHTDATTTGIAEGKGGGGGQVSLFSFPLPLPHSYPLPLLFGASGPPLSSLPPISTGRLKLQPAAAAPLLRFTLLSFPSPLPISRAPTENHCSVYFSLFPLPFPSSLAKQIPLPR